MCQVIALFQMGRKNKKYLTYRENIVGRPRARQIYEGGGDTQTFINGKESHVKCVDIKIEQEQKIKYAYSR